MASDIHFLKDVYALVLLYGLRNTANKSHVTKANCENLCFCKYKAHKWTHTHTTC